MTRRTLPIELEQAAETIADVSRRDLQILLRRAALWLRNADDLELDAEIEQAIDFLAGELDTDRSEVIRTIILDWLISAGRLPLDALDEPGETHGTA
jgi:hypothetical protein